MSLRYSTLMLLVFSPGLAMAQPTLDELWPNVDGTRWEYELDYASELESFTNPAALWLQGTVETAGGTAQVLYGEHAVPVKASTALPALPDPVLAAVWRARPDLREAITARTGVSLTGSEPWWPILLHHGYFMKGATNIQMWQPDFDHPTWTYLTNNLTVGATFTQQLIPEFADDVFLHGTVESIDATVTTMIGTFEHAVRMGYVIDYGWSEETDEFGNPIGLSRSETRGHVHYAPGVGPVEMLEDFIPYAEIDCSPSSCPPGWGDQLGQSFATITLSLTNRVVSIEDVSWGAVKALYRR
jgi:hypothetical protein